MNTESAWSWSGFLRLRDQRANVLEFNGLGFEVHFSVADGVMSGFPFAVCFNSRPQMTAWRSPHSRRRCGREFKETANKCRIGLVLGWFHFSISHGI